LGVLFFSQDGPLVSPKIGVTAALPTRLIVNYMKVLIYIAWGVRAWRIPDEQVAVLRRRFPDITFLHETNDAAAMAAIRDADVSFSSRLTEAMVESARHLRWVHSSAAAVADLLPVGHLARRNITVTNSRGIQAIPIAEQVMAGLLSLGRQLYTSFDAQRERRWAQDQLCETDWPWIVHGKNMTILGLGTIGTEVARRAAAFGIRVTAVRRRPDVPKPDFVDRVFGVDQLEGALTGSDILVIAAPFVANTNRLIGTEQIKMLNPGAILVNVARGQIVEEDATIQALRTGQLGGAVLDVFEQEPLERSSPLWNLANVIITPHSSGFRKGHWDEVIDLFTENLRRFRRGEPLLNPVDCAAGY